MLRIISAATLVPLLAGVAQAEPRFEASVAYSGYNFEQLDFVNAATARGTVLFGDTFGIEVEGAVGANDVKMDLPQGTAGTTLKTNVDLQQHYGAFAVARFPMNSDTELFARAGYAWSKFTLETPVNKTDVRGDGPTYGIGGHVRVSDTFGLRAEYSRFMPDSDDPFAKQNMDIISVGATVGF